MNKTIGYQAPQFRNAKSILELGNEFLELVEEFKIKARQQCASWPEKYAGLYFMYEGEPYYVGTGALACEDEEFVMIERELTDRLYELGAYEIFYAGMLD